MPPSPEPDFPSSPTRPRGAKGELCKISCPKRLKATYSLEDHTLPLVGGYLVLWLGSVKYASRYPKKRGTVCTYRSTTKTKNEPAIHKSLGLTKSCGLHASPALSNISFLMTRIPRLGFGPKLGSLFRSPLQVRHPYKKDRKKDPNLENHP